MYFLVFDLGMVLFILIKFKIVDSDPFSSFKIMIVDSLSFSYNLWIW